MGIIISPLPNSGTSSGGGSGTGPSTISYQAGEVNTGNTWVDGRPIYRYTFVNYTLNDDVDNFIPGVTGVEIILNITLGYKEDIFYSPYIESSGASNNRIYLENGALSLAPVTGTGIPNFTIDVIGYVEYVKEL